MIGIIIKMSGMEGFMQKPKKRNNTAMYRRLLNMTQSDVAKILNTGKSNIANMEAEGGHPTEAYRILLKIPPQELSAPPFSVISQLRKPNLLHIPEQDEELKKLYKPTSKAKLKRLSKRMNEPFETQSGKAGVGLDLSVLADDTIDTDLFVWTADRDYPKLKITKGQQVGVMPLFFYHDGTYLLYRETLSEFKIGQIKDGGTVLSALDGGNDPNILEVEFIGQIIS